MTDDIVARLPDAATRRLPDFIRTLRINREQRRESVYASDNVYALLDAHDSAEARVRALEAELADTIETKNVEIERAEKKAVEWKYMADRRADVCQQAIDQMKATEARVRELEKLCNETEAMCFGYAGRVRELEAKLAETIERTTQVEDGLTLLLSAIHADDPKREILVRVGDLMRDVSAIRQLAKEDRHAKAE